MRVLVTWGSKRGGTEGIARILGEALQHEGLDVDVLPARAAAKATSFDAVIVGGALYAKATGAVVSMNMPATEMSFPTPSRSFASPFTKKKSGMLIGVRA